MSVYICPDCNKDFKQKQNYISHTVKKKIPCKIIALINNSKDEKLHKKM